MLSHTLKESSSPSVLCGDYFQRHSTICDTNTRCCCDFAAVVNERDLAGVVGMPARITLERFLLMESDVKLSEVTGLQVTTAIAANRSCKRPMVQRSVVPDLHQ